jgi:hypothetical protein
MNRIAPITIGATTDASRQAWPAVPAQDNPTSSTVRPAVYNANPT